MKSGKRKLWPSRRLLPVWRREAGYVLPWVLILAMVAGLIVGPFLMFMMGGVRASYSYADTMSEFYAADSGIEDAIYKIQESHASLPDEVDETWDYSIDDVNGKEVDVTIENLWILDGLEDDKNGTKPHAELVLVGQVLDTPATLLSADIDDDDLTIDVLSTAAFPAASPESPRVIRIENELIRYTGIDSANNRFTGCERGIDGTTAADHDEDTAVTSNEVTYRVDITYDGSKGELKIERVGVWLPAGFSYVPGSSNMTTALEYQIFDTTLDIEVNTDPYTGTERFPDYGVIAIEDELIDYTSRTSSEFESCDRGQHGTTAAGHGSGTPVSAEPAQAPHRGGTALKWNFGDPENDNSGWIEFEDLPYENPSGGEGGFTPSAEFPTRRTLTFRFSPAEEPKGVFSWIRTSRSDVYLSWDTSSGLYQITSTATDPDTGTHTTLDAYVGSCRITGRVSAVYGDARAIGNSLMEDTNGDAYGIRDILLDYNTATVSDIPADAEIEAAYLYWSAWKAVIPNSIGNISGLNFTQYQQFIIDHVEELSELVNEADFSTDLGNARVTADRVQVLANWSSGPWPGWSYSCFKDVTSYLAPEESADITFTPEAGTPESMNINWVSGDAEVKLRAPSGNPDDMALDRDPLILENNNQWTDDISISESDSPLVLTSGVAVGSYDTRVRCTDGEVEVNGVTLGKNDQIDIIPLVTPPGALPQATIKRLTLTATVNITATDIPDGGDINVVGSSGTDILYETGDLVTRTIWGGQDDTLTGTTNEDYGISIACTSGMVEVTYYNAGWKSVVLGAPGSLMTNGDYTVGDIEGISTAEDAGDQWSYAGWSLIIIYSSPSEEAHQLYLYDNFLYAHNNTQHTFTVEGFLAPDDFEGRLTCFVGEGDDVWNGDYIQVNETDGSMNNRLPHSGDPYDGINPRTDVWNGKSSGLAGVFIDGVDIDTFEITETDEDVDEGDTAAVIHMGTNSDSWNLVYLFLSFQSDILPESGDSPVGVITYGYGGG